MARSPLDTDIKAVSPAPKPLWLLRWTCAGVAFAVGLLVLSIPNPDSGVWWASVHLSDIPLRLPIPTRIPSVGILITSVTAAGIMAWPSLRLETEQFLIQAPECRAGWMLWLLLYIGAVVGLSRSLGDPTNAEDAMTASLALSVAALIAIATASWCLTLMPALFWEHWIAHNRRLFGKVAGTGLLIYTLAHHYTKFVVANLPGLTDRLEQLMLELTALVLRLFTTNVLFDPQKNLIGTPRFAVYIDSACAGWEGMGLFAVLMTVYLWIYRRDFRFPNALFLLPIGLIALWLLNVVRIVTLVWIGTWNEALAMDGFHSVAGWLFFNAVTLAIVRGSWSCRLFAKRTLQSASSCSNPAAPYLVPALMIIATAMLTRILSHTFLGLYPCRVVVGAAALWFYWTRLSLRFQLSSIPIALGLCVFALWIVLQYRNSGHLPVAAEMDWAGLPTLGVIGWIAFRITGAVLIVPVAEELAFRGYILRRIVSIDFDRVEPRHFTWLAFVGSSVLFGALHAQWLAGTLAGMLFAFSFYRRGLLSDAILSHSVANATLAAYVLATGQWFLWK